MQKQNNIKAICHMLSVTCLLFLYNAIYGMQERDNAYKLSLSYICLAKNIDEKDMPHLDYIMNIFSQNVITGGPEKVRKQFKLRDRHNNYLYACSYCSYTNKQSGGITRHERIHTGEKPFKCTYPNCNFAARSSSNLNNHIKKKHRNERPYECSYCNFATAQKATLDDHIRAIHTGERPHKCSYCDYAAATKYTLDKHITAVHTGEKPYPCPYYNCNYAASTSSTLKKHKRKHHNE